MIPWVYVTVADVLSFHEQEVGEKQEVGQPVRDLGRLEAAVHRPQATAFGVDVFPDLYTKAAALFQAIDHGQPFPDGNKRAAWGAMRLFCLLNGFQFTMGEVDAYDFAMWVAESGSLLEVKDIAVTLKHHIIPIPDPPED
ncbi:MAG: death on curing protein [Actinomycetota bacterium]|nr:death on curing protein [Actinomycetota bacterium]